MVVDKHYTGFRRRGMQKDSLNLPAFSRAIFLVAVRRMESFTASISIHIATGIVAVGQ